MELEGNNDIINFTSVTTGTGWESASTFSIDKETDRSNSSSLLKAEEDFGSLQNPLMTYDQLDMSILSRSKTLFETPFLTQQRNRHNLADVKFGQVACESGFGFRRPYSMIDGSFQLVGGCIRLSDREDCSWAREQPLF